MFDRSHTYLWTMNEQNWIERMQWQDHARPVEELEREAVYTLFMGDFVMMPFIDYRELALLDPQLRALLN